MNRIISSFLIYIFLTLPLIPLQGTEKLSTMFYIVRHGQTDWNVQKKIQGQTDIPLNEQGRSDAVKISQKLKKVPFHACYSSYLQRASETLSLIFPHLPLNLDHRLIEKHYGKWEGRPASKYSSADSSEKENVETNDSVKKRVFQFLNEKALQHSGDNVLVVTHSGVMRSIINQLSDADDISKIQLKNGAIITLSYSNGQWSIEELSGIKGVKLHSPSH